jgi:hypothetical protein
MLLKLWGHAFPVHGLSFDSKKARTYLTFIVIALQPVLLTGSVLSQSLPCKDRLIS